MKEKNIQTKIMKKACSMNARLFRNHNARGVVGKIVAKVKSFNELKSIVNKRKEIDGQNSYYVVKYPRENTFGFGPDSPDLIGFKQVKITKEMVGKKLAVFTAIEVKKPGRVASIKQLRWLEIVKRFGGIVGIASSEEDLDEIFI